MKKQHLLTILLTLLFVSFAVGGAQAQTGTSISGDDVCGAVTPCKLTDIGRVTKGLLTLVVSLGLPLLVVFVTYRFVMAWFALQQGNANAYKDALKKAGNAIIGFLFIVALFGGLLLAALKLFGVNPTFLKFFELIADAFVPHAYAQGDMLPNPTPTITSLYDFILSVLRLVMRFFIYPAMIVIWVWTGFAFVAAQGNPDGLLKAKKWLLWAFITTLIVFMLQMFLLALKGTVQQILPGQQTGTSQNGTADGRVAPADGALNASCPGGQIGTNGCAVGRGAGGSNTASYCTDKAIGTLCTVGGTNLLGTCNNTDSVYGCYRATRGATCITSSGAYGTIDTNGSTCVIGGALPTNSTAGSYGGANYDNRIQGGGDIPCAQQNGGSCRKSGLVGSCSDWSCVTP